MSSKTTIPGYAGFIPNFQREYPTTKNTPAYKYEDINMPERTLMDSSNYISNYAQSHSEKAIVHLSQRRHAEQDGHVTKFEAAAQERNKELQRIRKQNVDIR